MREQRDNRRARCGAAGLVAAMLTIGGCAAPVIVASAGLSVAQYGASSYINGKLNAARRVPMDVAFEAGIAAMTPLGFEPTEVREPGEHGAYLATRQHDGTPITIRFTRISSEVTKVQVRVGLFGDQTLSRLIMANIDAQLRDRGHALPDVVPPGS